MKTIIALILTLSLVGCSYFETPEREYYVYEAMTGKCFKVVEYGKHLDYEDWDCHKIPIGAKEITVQEWEIER